MSRCFFREFAPAGLRECQGPMQRHHVIKKQTIKRLFPQLPMFATDEEVRENKRRLAAAQKDDRDLLWACKRHHDLHEKAKRIPVPREELPEAVELFAADYGLVYELERQFGPLEGGEGL
jgi:hypothetical protein